MGDFDSISEQIGLELDPVLAEMCRWLEKRGLRFCIDFGYSNAQDMVIDILDSR